MLGFALSPAIYPTLLQLVQRPHQTSSSWMCSCHPSGHHDWQNTCPRWSSSCWPLSFSPCQHFSRHPGIDPWGLPYHPAASPHTQAGSSQAQLIIVSTVLLLFYSCEPHSFCSPSNWNVPLYFYSASGCNCTLFSLVWWSLFCSVFMFASLQFTPS